MEVKRWNINVFSLYIGPLCKWGFLEESRLTLEDFAKRLGITNEDLSLLISGEQSLSIDMASKLSCLIGTSAEYWLNLQHSFDIITAEFASNQELRND